MKEPKVYNKHHRNAPPGAKYIGRGSPFGNPFVIGKDGTREEVVEKYRIHVEKNPELQKRVVAELRGEDLVCFCKPLSCHGDILLEVANG